MIEKIADGEGRPYKVTDKINEIINEVNEMKERYDAHVEHFGGITSVTHEKVGKDDSVTE